MSFAKKPLSAARGQGQGQNRAGGSARGWRDAWLVAAAAGVVLAGLLVATVASSPAGRLGTWALATPGFSALVIFQNEAELRPGGGFITAFGLLEGGRLIVADSYSVAPPAVPQPAPAPLAAAFAADEKFDQLFARDANFFNFPSENMPALRQLLAQDKRFGRADVDAIITVNVAGAAALLQALGAAPNAEDFFMMATRRAKNVDLHNRKALANRKNFLADLAGEISLFGAAFRLPSVLAAADAALARGDIAVHLPGDLQGPSGAVFGYRFANMGAKKSDHFVHRRAVSVLEFSNADTITERLEISLQNPAPAGMLADTGQYLVRVLRPAGTTLLGGDWQAKEQDGYMEFWAVGVLEAGGAPLAMSGEFSIPKQALNNLRLSGNPGATVDAQLHAVGRGEQRFEMHGCPAQRGKYGAASCQLVLGALTQALSITQQPDRLPPLLEAIWRDAPREVLLRFSETVQETIGGARFACAGEEFAVEQVVRGQQEQRDLRLVLGRAPGGLLTEEHKENKEFCQLEMLDVQDAAGNAANIRVTVPRNWQRL